MSLLIWSQPYGNWKDKNQAYERYCTLKCLLLCFLRSLGLSRTVHCPCPSPHMHCNCRRLGKCDKTRYSLSQHFLIFFVFRYLEYTEASSRTSLHLLEYRIPLPNSPCMYNGYLSQKTELALFGKWLNANVNLVFRFSSHLHSLWCASGIMALHLSSSSTAFVLSSLK